MQEISTLLAIPSQCALQYFEPGGAMQLQAALAHFLEFAMGPPEPVPSSTSGIRFSDTMQDIQGK